MENEQLPEYRAPMMTTYTDEQILEEMGPAQTVTSGGGRVALPI